MTALLVGLHLAAAVWGPLPCGQPNVEARVFPSGDLSVARAALGGGESVAPGYETPPCTILLNESVVSIDTAITGVNGVVLCSTIIHEEGHLLGLGHSTDPTNVMYPNAPDQPGCMAAYRAALRARTARRRRPRWSW